MIVSDSGPLIGFARVARLDLLRRVIGEVYIPEAVYEEVVVRGERKPGATEIARATWIVRKPLDDLEWLRRLPGSLHAGEREAIALAWETGLPLLMDELRGRSHADQLGIRLYGILAVLGDGRRRGLIGAVAPVIDELRASGYRLKDRVVQEFLGSIGEPAA